VRFKRVISFVLCAVMAVIIVGGTGGSAAVAKSVSDYQNDLNAAISESNRIKKEISALKQANAPYEQQQAALKKQIEATQKEIDLYNERISEVNDKITTLENNIKEKEAELQANKETFKQRLVAMYISGSNSELEVLLAADDFADFLTKTELIRSVTSKDTKLLDSIISAINEIELSKTELVSARDEQASAKSVVAEKQADLESQYEKLNRMISENEDSVAALEQKQSDYEKMIEDANAELAKLKGTVTGTGQFMWPLPGFYSITSPYGYRWHPISGTYSFHSGVDISGGGVYGARILAADSGTVILSSWNGGYGNCVMISHGNGYVTLYAHMKQASSLRVGQSVSKGDTVGYVGSTGNSTGPHLHFEIRLNGSTQNPMNWF
jgi:murein DD-endopeptidase MepM/ murein hydrolase activator NlpD